MHGEQHTVLVVADWSVDPHVVIASCSARACAGVSFALVVPAWLHGLGWAGDPRASLPCARRQVDLLVGLSRAAGLELVAAEAGDPDPVAAIADALRDHDV